MRQPDLAGPQWKSVSPLQDRALPLPRTGSGADGIGSESSRAQDLLQRARRLLACPRGKTGN